MHYVEIDSNLPCVDEQPVFSGEKSELWVALLEKAWCKLQGSYLEGNRGTSNHALRDLTGAPTYSFSLEEATRLKMLDAEENKYLMTAKTKSQMMNP